MKTAGGNYATLNLFDIAVKTNESDSSSSVIIFEKIPPYNSQFHLSDSKDKSHLGETGPINSSTIFKLDIFPIEIKLD